jgi:diguanylate cyclase (GGDEF)-like protein/PAS domain S-box-containing protein
MRERQRLNARKTAAVTETSAFSSHNGQMTDQRESATQAEATRLTSLLSLNLLDTPAEGSFDAVTRLAAFACGTSSAAVTLVDADRAWFKSRVCVGVPEMPREHAFCSLEITRGDLLVIPDTHLDPRCAANPLIAGEGAVRFYAGAPLIVAPTGACVGRLCVFDTAPRDGLTAAEEDALLSLAGMIVERMESTRFRQIGHMAAKVADVTSDAILCADAGGRITYWNAAAESMFGHAAEIAIGSPLSLIMPEGFREAHAAGFARAAAGGAMTLQGKPVELVGLRANGSTFPIELSLGRWHDGATVAFAAIVRDISSRKLLEHEREQARLFLDTVIENLPAMLFVKNAEDQRYLLMNKAGAEIAGRPQGDFVGCTDSELFPGQGEAYEARDRAAKTRPGIHIFESEYVRADGQRYSLRTKRLVIDAPPGGKRLLLGMTEDMTEARRAQAEVRRLAEYDSLTGLRNRGGFVARIDHLVATMTPFTVLSIDLDRFKSVNDQFGHLAGDEVLVEVGVRLARVVSAGDVVARVGGDEFVLLLIGHDAPDRARALAPEIVAVLEEPITTTRALAYVGCSIGGAAYPTDGDTSIEVRQAADLALYRAKESGRGSTCFYDSVLDAALRERRRLEHALRLALEQDSIDVAFQPVFSTETRLVTSFEALARWHHPTKGPIPPSEFIVLAEECGLVEALGTSVLRRACDAARSWPDDVAVAVNLSPLQFQTGRLCETVRSVLAASGLRAGRLQLEVTEGLLIRDVERTFQQLEELRAIGIQILMDDFGVGYSSLSYFQRFPFDKVKIDRSFVETAPTALAAQAIIRAVTQVGQTLGMGVVAEGVETEEQMRMLVSLGCTHVQGYLLGRPLAGTMVDQFLRANRAGAGMLSAPLALAS